MHRTGGPNAALLPFPVSSCFWFFMLMFHVGEMEFLQLIVAAGAFFVGAALTLLIAVAGISRHRKASPEIIRLIGALASVEKELTPEGAVLVRGELWRARTSGDVIVGRGRDNVRVVGLSNHLLIVE
ncbi:MAG: NfeD family protein, partial [Acidobacteriota bacterium]|nr:NfeD family protein [Acidobacteriota bacterium]